VRAYCPSCLDIWSMGELIPFRHWNMVHGRRMHVTCGRALAALR
jgi:hypothetical protein